MRPVVTPYKPRNHVRIVSAASLFDGHDAAINVMRRLMAFLFTDAAQAINGSTVSMATRGRWFSPAEARMS